ncbi:MAG: FAD-dependent monooxygenase [Bradyrhizobium sp.]|nr:MAG: FAD-dependent monooxygenase [Bradyrhizobium sp.]
MKIAVVGAGISGLSAAAFLKRSGHDVVIYEQFDTPRPLGSGLMLQPTGLAVLARLGLDKAAIGASSPILGIQGRVAGAERVIFDVSYRTLAPHLFGLGIHRGTLFSLLHDETNRQKIPVVTSVVVADATYDADNKPLLGDGKNRHGPFDLVINAQGMRSPLRQKFAEVKKDRMYPYAAVWGVCRDTAGAFKNHLYQRYQKARHMIGVMPVGKLNGDACESVAFFWSLRTHEYDLWREQGLQAWRRHVVALWPEVEALAGQFETLDDLSFATYGDVVLRSCCNHRMVSIGDAAHATSPQLGQGANMGLMDALVLDECLRQTEDVNAAIKTYAEKRKRHIGFYQTASHWLTPFFQSDASFHPILRDATFGLMCKLPYLGTEMVRTLAGVKTGLFTSMNPGTIHPDYDLSPDNSSKASRREFFPTP